MTFSLSPEADAAGYRLVSRDSIGSTNSEALALILAGERGPLWVAAREQTSGRGRRGRAWSTTPGNLAASLGRGTDLPLATLAQLGFVAGAALVSALDRCAPAASRLCRLKWPNDLVCDAGKLAGILLEAEARPEGGHALAVGIGVNVAAAPPEAPYPVASLAGLGAACTSEALFLALSAAWIEAERIWDRGRGFAAVRALWLERAGGIGAEVCVRTGPEQVRGVFETIDEGGRLVLRAADGGRSLVAAGDVHFGPAATTAGAVPA
jgi:BirA family biotin operon repressor/biotin-[acetyl-CoA-carboxylase] ligase